MAHRLSENPSRLREALRSIEDAATRLGGDFYETSVGNAKNALDRRVSFFKEFRFQLIGLYVVRRRLGRKTAGSHDSDAKAEPIRPRGPAFTGIAREY
jgi:hypothetical protein